MTMTVASIAASAFDAVAANLGGVIQAATITRKAGGSYNAATGAYTAGTSTYTGRAVIATSTQLVEDQFPEFVMGPTDDLVYLEGFSVAPKETDKLTLGSVDRRIMIVRDVVGAGTFFAVIAR